MRIYQYSLSIDRFRIKLGTAIIFAIIISAGPTLRESILGNRGIRKKGGGRRRRGGFCPTGPFLPPRSQDGHFLRSQSTVIGYCS